MLSPNCPVADPHSSQATPFAPTSQILRTEAGIPLRFAAGGSGLPYYLYVPPKVDPGMPPFVAVHGISRNALEHIETFFRLARDSKRVLVAPVFSTQACRRYQRLGRDPCRADEAFLKVLEDVTGITHVSTEVIELFGFSAGAQFAHRFAMLYPERVASLMLSSAGWYTYPSAQQRFPYGVAEDSAKGRLASANLERFLAIPMLVMVGERDVSRDRGLRQERRVDRLQGYTRVERAGRWVQSLRNNADYRGIPSDISFRLLSRCGHSLSECVNRGALVEQVSDWLER